MLMCLYTAAVDLVLHVASASWWKYLIVSALAAFCGKGSQHNAHSTEYQTHSRSCEIKPFACATKFQRSCRAEDMIVYVPLAVR
eukprot:m.776482 g.776482  ORF g.776482 m.776482 type:complete len:84 (+) comp23263_c0_seq16:3004-3255(+)